MNAEQATPARLAEASSLRLVLTLSFAGLLSGLIIVGAYEATLPTITAYKAQMLREAVFRVLPGVTRMQRLVYRDGKLTAAADERAEEAAIFGGYDAAGQLVGYAISGAGPGFQDTIRLLYGYLPGPRKVLGMEILESRETPGLGDKIYKDAAFVANFHDLAVDPQILAVKKGRKTSPNQIDAITGATISSKAVVRIINQANAEWLPRLEGPVPAPAAE
jgi:Na+-translocating ferredoxin:NAD+ oxidoreductase subunit G